MTFQVKIGDDVAYSKAFCQNTGNYFGDIPHARGIVIALESLPSGAVVASVDWNYSDVPNKVLVCNLAKPGPNTRFCG